MIYTNNMDVTHGMQPQPSAMPGHTREAVGVFMNIDDLQAAVRDLEGTAFPRQDISVMGTREELMEVFGNKTVDPHVAMESDATPRDVLPRPEEKTIGTAAMVGIPAYVGAMGAALAGGAVAFPGLIAAAVIGGLGGGTLGAILVKLMGDRDVRHYEEQIERGGLLLWVRTPDREREEIAIRIMRARNGREVHIHDISSSL